MCCEFWGARGVTCTLDDCSCKRTSCALRLGLHWAVRSCGGSSACQPARPPACLPTSTIHGIDHAATTPLLREKPNHQSSSNYCWWATSFYQSRQQSRTVAFQSQGWKKRNGRTEWQPRGRKEREKGRMRWQARAAGGTFHVELCQDGCRT